MENYTSKNIIAGRFAPGILPDWPQRAFLAQLAVAPPSDPTVRILRLSFHDPAKSCQRNNKQKWKETEYLNLLLVILQNIFNF
jgi:hypothetical protein